MGTLELTKMGLIQFSGKGPWAEYEQRMFVYLRSQGLLQGLTKVNNIVNEQGFEVITTLQPNATNAAKLAAYKTDMQISQIITSTLIGEAYDYNSQKFPITKETRDDDFLGLKLWLGLTERFNCPLIRPEIFKKKMEILSFHFNGNIQNFLKSMMTMRHDLIANAKFNDLQITLLDEDIIQAILAKLPHQCNAFVLAMRAIQAYTMSVAQLVEKIGITEREMMPHQKHQETAAFTNWKKKKNSGKGKNKGEKKSDIVDSTLTPIFNPNLKIKSNSNYFINIPKSSNSQNIKFLLDTGASCHIVNKIAFFYKYVDCTEETVKVANGETVKIK